MSDVEMVELKRILDEVAVEWRKSIMASFWRDGDGYIPPPDPVDEFMDEVRDMLNE